MTFPAAIALKEKTGKPLIVHIHSTEYDRSGGNEGYAWVREIEKDAMKIADTVVAVSDYSAKILCEQFEAEAEKIATIHNGIEKMVAFRSNKDFPEKLVTFLGRVTKQKSPDIFFKIALKVLEKHDNVRFVIAGKGGMLAEVMAEAAKHKVSEKFHFAGFLEKEEVNSLLSMTDIFVMPSASDPFGIAALEAAQFGVPCIISRQSGCLEVIKGALTADWKDVDLMADYVNTLLSSTSLATEIGRNNQESVQNATWENNANKVLEVYATLLKARKGELVL
jgi:glycosyltransferase involved in cell wall biosynthesis